MNTQEKWVYLNSDQLQMARQRVVETLVLLKYFWSFVGES